MDNFNGDKDNRNEGGNNVVGGAINVLQKTLDTAKKAVKYTRFLSNFIMGGWPIFALVGSAIVAIAFYSIVFGQMAPIPGGSVPKIIVEPGTAPKIPGLTLKLTGPVKVNNGEALRYTVEVIYTLTTPPLSNITVYEVLPQNTTFLDASGAFTYENGQIIWPMSKNDKIFTFTLTPTTPDIEIKNQVYAQLTGSSSTGGGNVPPSYTDCGNSSYAQHIEKNPDKSNFGDPECNFDEAKLFEALKKEDPSNADFWYKCALLEASYIPVAYAPPSTGTPDAGGAWGLYQMGRGKNGPTDHGDVNWPNQITNAIGHSKLTSSFKEYWQCARDLNYDGIR